MKYRRKANLAIPRPPLSIPLRSAVFNPRLYVRVRRMDQLAQGRGIYGRSRPQLHVAHKLAVAHQQAGRIRQPRALKEPHVYVRGEYIDVAERRISQARNRTAVMQELP